MCVPGLNCYSCPGAVGSCPIGSLQSSINAVKYKVSLYVAGLLILFGSILGRFICGWLCPFGLIQEMLHIIPLLSCAKGLYWGAQIRQIRDTCRVRAAHACFVFPHNRRDCTCVLQIHMPGGYTQAGVPLVSLNESLRQAAGLLFDWKMLLLAITVISSVFIYRPFCRFICPLGAICAV